MISSENLRTPVSLNLLNNYFMFRRIVNIGLIVIMIMATGGIPVTMHYCGSVARSFSVFSTPKPCCDSHCPKCHNVFKFNKLNDEFEVGGAVASESLANVIILHTAGFINVFDNLLTSLPTVLNSLRKFLIPESCLSLAFFGNFRC